MVLNGGFSVNWYIQRSIEDHYSELKHVFEESSANSWSVDTEFGLIVPCDTSEYVVKNHLL